MTSLHSCWVFLGVLVISPTLLCVVHILLSQGMRIMGLRISPLRLMFLAGAAGFFVTLTLAWHTHLAQALSRAEFYGGIFYVAMVYGCLAYAYLHLFLMGETARRLHILYELRTQGGMSKEKMAERYSAHAMLNARLERLTRSGQLELRDGRYVIKSRFLLRASKAIMVWAQCIGFRPQI